MNNHDLFRALGDIDDAFLEDCEEIPLKKKRIPYSRYISLAVAACLCVAVLFLSPLLVPGDSSGNDADTFSSNANTAEGAEDPCGESRTLSPTYASIESAPDSTLGCIPEALPPQSVGGAVPPFDSEYRVPSDFEFTLIWNDDVYRSTDLPAHLLQDAWNLLSKLSTSPAGVHGSIELTFTANGTTGFIAAEENGSDAAFSICAELQSIFQQNHISPQNIR